MFPLPAPVLSVLNTVESTREPLRESEVASRLSRLQFAVDLPDPERDGARAETTAFNLWPSDQSPWGTHFGPFFSAIRPDGAPYQVPDLADIDDEVIAHWEDRSVVARHPVLEARYADAVWDLKQRATNKRPDISVAHRAVDAYLDTIKQRLCPEPLIVPIHLCERALTIALSISNTLRIQRSKEVLLDLFAKSQEPGHMGCWCIAYDALIGTRKVGLTTEEQRCLIAGLERMLKACSTDGEPAFDPLAAQAAAERLARHYERQGAKTAAKRVIRTYGMAFEAVAAKADPALALAWLQPVHDDYFNRGMNDDATRVRKASSEKGKDVGQSLKRISAPVTITHVELREYVEAVTAGTLREALLRIARYSIPDLASTRGRIVSSRKEFPLTSLFQTLKIVDDHIAVRAGTPEEDLDSHIILQLAQELPIHNYFLTESIQHLRHTHDVTTPAILDVLYESPVFELEQRPLLTEGIQAYLDGDHVKAIHVIIPQIEASLRRLLKLTGQSHLKSGRNGTMQVKNLNDILRESAIKKSLGDNITIYLLCLLADERGLNIRNNISHGMAHQRTFTQETGNQVLHALLTLALIRQQPDNQPSERA